MLSIFSSAKLQSSHNLKYCLSKFKHHELISVNFTISVAPAGYAPPEFEIRWIDESSFFITCYTVGQGGAYHQSSRCRVMISGSAENPIFDVRRVRGPYLVLLGIFLIPAGIIIDHYLSIDKMALIKESIFIMAVVVIFFLFLFFGGAEGAPEYRFLKKLIGGEKSP